MLTAAREASLAGNGKAHSATWPDRGAVNSFVCLSVCRCEMYCSSRLLHSNGQARKDVAIEGYRSLLVPFRRRGMLYPGYRSRRQIAAARAAPQSSKSIYCDSKNTPSPREEQVIARHGWLRHTVALILGSTVPSGLYLQNKFRYDVSAEDSICLEVSSQRADCTAARLAPVSRFDVSPNKSTLHRLGFR